MMFVTNALEKGWKVSECNMSIVS